MNELQGRPIPRDEPKHDGDDQITHAESIPRDDQAIPKLSLVRRQLWDWDRRRTGHEITPTGNLRKGSRKPSDEAEEYKQDSAEATHVETYKQRQRNCYERTTRRGYGKDERNRRHQRCPKDSRERRRRRLRGHPRRRPGGAGASRTFFRRLSSVACVASARR
jgi:hypothetical protein